MYIKARELRIGNAIHNPVQDIDLIVDGSLIAIENSREKTNKNHIGFSGVLLSREWMLRLGFTEYGKTLNFTIPINHYWTCGAQKQGKLKIKVTKTGYFRVENFANKTINMVHVHQLQNLYFAMTGTELIINNK